MSVDNEVALDLGCERCARVYLAVFRNSHVSWLEKTIRDAKMRHWAVKSHFSGRRDECG
ncbi:MAG: hypothetical protein OEZ35_05615 [Candidatus Bathyarchaeota archaeon]|nr:hypothetical protein [Candidatus Bathyarchaeota archaeon]